MILLSVGRDPFASTASARSTDDGIGIIGAFTVLYLFVIVAVAVARLPRHSSDSDRSHGMTAPATLPRYAHRRGTRGFAAFVTGLAGFVVLGVGAVVLPTVQIDSIALSWLIPLTVAFGVAHFVAAYGLHPSPGVERPSRRLPGRDRHRHRRLRPDPDADRRGSVRGDQHAAVRPGHGRKASASSSG